MSEDPEVRYVTVINPSMVKGPRACTCGCGGCPRHRERLVMDEWADERADGTREVPVLWPTKLSAGERDRFERSLQEHDATLGRYVPHPEWARSHWIAFCARDHENHRVWEDLEEARRQLEELDDDIVVKIVAACDHVQIQPGRAEKNAGDPSKTTSSDKPSGDTPETPGTPLQAVS